MGWKLNIVIGYLLDIRDYILGTRKILSFFLTSELVFGALTDP
jgi:hypothetical protein